MLKEQALYTEKNASKPEAFFMLDDFQAARPMQVIDGVAVITIEGVMAREVDFFTQLFGGGGTSTREIIEQINTAVNSPAVNSVLLVWDSPGGTVDGTEQLGDAIAAAARTKRTVSLATSVMASAAYWAGSAANEIYIDSSTTMVGSIGVVQTHIDISKRDEKIGIKRTDISAGKFKRIASIHSPLTDEGKETLQAQVDYIYGLFTETVAAHRSVSVEQVIDNMADGRTFTGQQAIDAGLVDGKKTFDQLLSEMVEASPAPQQNRHIRADSNHSTTKDSLMLTKEQVANDHPEIAAALRADGEAIGAENERGRILAVLEQSMTGHEDLIQKLAFDGQTTGPEAAVQVLKAEKAQQAKIAAELDEDAPAPAPNASDNQSDKPAMPGAKQLASEANDLIAQAESQGKQLSLRQAMAQVKQQYKGN
tara:strand:- start:174 stop:1442 length:1269 start_codon:yes stop_codon:yes gene_type:complete